MRCRCAVALAVLCLGALVGGPAASAAPAQEAEPDLTWSVRPVADATGATRPNFSFAAEPGATVSDALEFLIAGATTVGLGTALFYDPLLCGKINAGVADYLKLNNLRGISGLVGSLRTD